jgi:ATP-dependent Clp protease, protease subunit
LERDTFLTADMAKDFRLVDKVIDKRPVEDLSALSAKLWGHRDGGSWKRL